jgi:ribosome maturation factor RimP
MGFAPIFYFSIMDLQTLIEPTLVGMGYEMVALERVGRGLLRLYIDKPEGINLDDCVKVSNQLTRLFMVENVDYDRLEVSSPGLDRPLVKEADFVRFVGERANIRLHAPLEGRKRFTGVLGGLTDGVLQLDVDGVMVAIPLAEVDSARLAPVLEGHTRRMR